MRSLVALAFAAMSAILAFHTSAGAQPRGEEAAPEFPSEIEVLGQREIARQVFQQNLRKMTERLSVFEPIPRFVQPLCVGVTGLEPDQARFVSDRIRATSIELGLGQASAKCRANALVIVVNDPERMYRKLVSKRLSAVGVLPFRDVHTRRVENELRDKRPVVWWNILGTANTQGATFNDLGLVTTQNISGSRTVSPTYLRKTLSVVMYDANQLGGATLGQIADHAALYLLGTPRRDIDFDKVQLPSILSLFDAGPASGPEGFTDFDRAYLEGLYALRPGAFQSQVPRSVVTAYADRCEAQQSDCRIQLSN